jgi:hypothetical protein
LTTTGGVLNFDDPELTTLPDDIFTGLSSTVTNIDLSKTSVKNVHVSRSASGPFKGVSRNTFIYLPAGNGNTVAEGEPNVVIGAVCDNMQLAEDDQAFSPAMNFGVVSATLGREFVADRTSTVYLPFAVDKATADASSWKKKYMETQSESEKLSMEKAERDAALKEELEMLRKESAINKFAKSFMGCGYSEDMAVKAAEAQYSGDTDELFRLQKLHADNMAKQIRADIMKSMPVPATGNDDGVHITQEQFDKMSYMEQLDLFEKHPSVYEKLTTK